MAGKGTFNKDHAIIAQNATGPAAALAAAVIGANPEHSTTTQSALDLFDAIRTHIFNGSVALANGIELGEDGAAALLKDALGAEPVNAPKAGASGGGSSDLDPGDVVVNMGKHRGKTIRQIHDEAPEYVRDFLGLKTNNDFLRKKAQAFLASL